MAHDAAAIAGEAAADAKVRLRREVRARRTAAARADPGAARALAWRAAALPRSATVSGYWPVRDEIDPGPLMEAFATRARIALPRIGPDGMAFVVMGPDDAMVDGAFGLREPSGRRVVVPDLVLVPLLAFTRRGDRLGYGKGHYDRWLAAHPDALTVGLAYAAQEMDGLPVEPHDQPLDAVLTERELIAVSGRVG